MSINYTYVLDWLQEHASKEHIAEPRVLDFGCGAGEIVAAGIKRGLDIWGADPFQGIQADLHQRMAESREVTLSDRILRIENDVLPFPADHFDVVISNQVFEHVAYLEKPLQEIKRVLRPGGIFLSLFPVRETWWEGHCEVYFAHWFKPHSNAQIRYLAVLKKLGLGYRNKTSDPGTWALEFADYLRDYCFYRSSPVIDSEWEKTFGSPPANLNVPYMFYRLKHSKLAGLQKIFDNAPGRLLLSFVCRARAGRVLLIRKAA